MGWFTNKDSYGSKNEYLVYYKQLRSQNQLPMTYAQWLINQKKKSKTTLKTKAVSKELSAGGLTQTEINKLRGIK